MRLRHFSLFNSLLEYPIGVVYSVHKKITIELNLYLTLKIDTSIFIYNRAVASLPPISHLSPQIHISIWRGG